MKVAKTTKNDQRDKFKLYQNSVQNVEFEVPFIRRVYRKIRGRDALRLREDFCGSASLACEWVRRVKNGTAVGIDLDGPTLDYARKKNAAKLGSDAERLELRKENVLTADGKNPDIVAAYNFSYFIFKRRKVLLDYFRAVRNSLADDGVFMLDIFGGPEAQILQEESTEHDDFSYVWDQARFNPITGELFCHIHFDFPDDARMRRAFTYDWRLWSIPEVIDALEDAGYQNPTVYWEGTDRKDGGGNGVFRESTKGDNASCFIAYIIAPK